MQKYGKAIVAVIAAVLTFAYGALSGDQRIDAEEWVQIGIAAATAIGVYLVPLAPQYRWGKTAVAAVLGVLQALATVVLGGLDASEWIVLALAAAAVLGAHAAPAVSGNGISSRPVANSRSTADRASRSPTE
jgi:O-antigen/teichoic acid export membrane protein